MKIERCAGHEVNNVPQAWESVFESSDRKAVMAELEERIVSRGASGAQFRVVDGTEVLSPEEFFVLYA